MEVAQAKGIFEDHFALDDLPEPAQNYYYATLDLMDSMILGNQVKGRTLGYFDMDDSL